MKILSNCKINLGLHIVSKRKDGFHNLETVFYPVNFYDTLTVDKADNYSFTCEALDATVSLESNLCTKAFRLIERIFTDKVKGASITLDKLIPHGAGLGGGSSNGANVLKALNMVYNLGLDTVSLQALALQLGSDCPFFLLNKPILALGRGEVFSQIPLNLKGMWLLLLMPEQKISTSEAFKHVVPRLKSETEAIAGCPKTDIVKTLALPPAEWKDNLSNDFEVWVFSQYPELKGIKNLLYESGAVYAQLSGSGSAIFGLFDTIPNSSSFDAFGTTKLVLLT